MTPRPRVGLLVLFVPFYEPIVQTRPAKEVFATTVRSRLSEVADVVGGGLIDAEDVARQAAEQFQREQVDGVVVVSSIAAFGALGWAALESLAVPVLLWNIQPASRFPSRYDIAELIRNSGNLGTEALANTLAREGRFFRTCFSTGDAPLPAHGLALLRAAATASALRRSTFGRIGTVFPQMTDVAMDPSSWTARTGSHVVDVSPAELTRAYREPDAQSVAGRREQIALGRFVHDITGDELDRSARLSLALDALVERHRLDGGAFNCHAENCLRNPEIGVTACYAVSHQTSAGHPFSCTGDLPTAIALFLMKRLSGVALYGELDFVDPGENLVVIANGGEGDFTAAAGAVEILGNENFKGLHGRGASPRMSLDPGPATLLSFTPVNSPRGYRLVVGAGELVHRPIQGLAVLHEAYRFDGLCAERAFEQWCDAGAVHHLALAPGDWTRELSLFARMMDFEYQQVGGRHACD